jgi:UDP-GlcNAc:undecaprenyl-phosphate GlcNAc-1-phosphate transferase
VAALIVAGVVSWLWCAFATWLGPRSGFVDIPDGSDLKVHDAPAVPLGGVGIFLGVHLAMLVGGDFDLSLLIATAIVLVLGLVDDRIGLSPVLRLVVEVVATLVLVAGLTPDRDSDELLLAAIVVVVAINAVNLFDGLDGLVGSAGVVTALGLVFLASLRDANLSPAPELAVALLGFLVLGWHPARVFLGDSGAYVTGMLLATSMINASPAGASQLLIASTFLGVIALDLLVTLIRRQRGGHPLFTGDRSHIYDQLRDRGWGVTKVVYFAAGVQVLLVIAGLAVDTFIGGWPGVAAIAGMWVVLLGLLAKAVLLGGSLQEPRT